MSDSWWLLAIPELGRSFREYADRSNSFSDNWVLFMAAVAIAVLYLAFYFWDKTNRGTASPRETGDALFRELCRFHELERSERALLERVAEYQHLKQPAVVFVDPRTLGRQAELSPSEADSCRNLVRRLFGRDYVSRYVTDSEAARTESVSGTS